jgi:alkylated DNA repair dioxygenase AlkB
MEKTSLYKTDHSELYSVPNVSDIIPAWLDLFPYDIEPKLGKKPGVPGDRYQRRDVCFLSNVIPAYKYSGYTAVAQPLDDPILINLLTTINEGLNTSFNSILINRYQDGSKYVSLHSDYSRYIDNDHPVGQISYGESRVFRVRAGGTIVIDHSMQHGELLMMTGAFQSMYGHEIPKRANINRPCYVMTLFSVISR